MPTPIFAGNTAPLRQRWALRYSPSSGGEVSQTLQGIDINQMIARAGIEAANGVSCDLSYEKNIASLTLSSTDPSAYGFANIFTSVTDKWEVGVDQEKPELFENPNFLSIFTSANTYYGTQVDQQFFQLIKASSEQGLASWKEFKQRLLDTNIVDNNGNEIAPGGLFSEISAGTMYEAGEMLDAPTWGNMTGKQALKFFFEEYARGRTNFARGKYVLRHTTMAPSNYGANVADFNVEKIYTISQLLSEAQNAGLWVLPLPGYLAYKILAYPVPVNMPPNYVWGALKMRSNAVAAARGRVEISTEYLIDAVSVPTYGVI